MSAVSQVIEIFPAFGKIVRSPRPKYQLLNPLKYNNEKIKWLGFLIVYYIVCVFQTKD